MKNMPELNMMITKRGSPRIMLLIEVEIGMPGKDGVNFSQLTHLVPKKNDDMPEIKAKIGLDTRTLHILNKR
jgi:hypothetical protein